MNSRMKLGALISMALMGVSQGAQLITSPFRGEGSAFSGRSRFSRTVKVIKNGGRKLHRIGKAESRTARNQRAALGRNSVVGKAARAKQARFEARRYTNQYLCA